MSIAAVGLSEAPDQILQQALYGNVPEIKPYDALGELNKRVKNKQLGAAMQGNNAIQQAQQMQQQPPVAQQLVAQLGQGVGSLPMPETNAYASGGIVAFDEGGFIDRLPEDSLLRRLRNWIDRGRPMPYDKPLLDYLGDVVNRKAPITEKSGVPFDVGDMGPVVPPKTPIAPPNESGIAAPTTPPGTPARDAAPVTRTGIATLQPPEYKEVIPEYEIPEEKTAQELEAENAAMIAPKMQEYDNRMQKYMDRAERMQRGEGVKKPTRLERSLNAFMAGATAEYAAARAAGVRPSLGAALAAAGGAASKADAELADKVEAMQDKGYEAALALEQSRLAYESGQKELGAKWQDKADRIKAEVRGVRNQMSKDEQERAEKLNDWSMELYKSAVAQQEKEKDRQNALAAASIRAESSGQQLTPARLAEIRRKVEVDVDKELEKNPAYMRAQFKDPQVAAQMRSRALEDRLQRVLMEEMGATLPGASGATPDVAAPSGWGKAELVSP